MPSPLTALLGGDVRGKEVTAIFGSGNQSKMEVALSKPRGSVRVADRDRVFEVVHVDADAKGSAIAAIREVTEDARVEDKLVTSERLRALGILAAGAAHEIRNPLAYVSANVSVVLEDLSRSNEPGKTEMRRALKDARIGCERIREIVSDLMLLARDSPSAACALDAAHLRAVHDDEGRRRRNRVGSIDRRGNGVALTLLDRGFSRPRAAAASATRAPRSRAPPSRPARAAECFRAARPCFRS